MKSRIELHAKTKYSIDHESTLDIKELILKCASNGEAGVAIVDKGSVLSFYKAEKILKELDIKDFRLIYGVEVNVFFERMNYKAVILLKKRNGLLSLYRMLSPYCTTNRISLEELLVYKEDFLIGLIYDINNFNANLLRYFNYVEVDSNVPKDVISDLKRDTLVVYSNRVNALSKDEELSKKMVYNKLGIKEKIDTRIYKNTQDILKEINDIDIVVENTNKVFDMIEKFDLLDDMVYLPINEDFSIDLLVYLKLNEKFGNNIPFLIKKRVDEELKLIKMFNYEGFIILYKKIIDKCKDEQEEYVICDYINYLYIAYLLEITHFDPIKFGLNVDLFFSNYLKINIMISDKFSYSLDMFIKEELNVNIIKCKGLMKLNRDKIKNMIFDYEKRKNIKISEDNKLNVYKYLDDYPINNNAVTSKKIIIPSGVNVFAFTPREVIKDGCLYHRFTNVDYRDIEKNFITLELIPNEKLTWLTELKKLTGDLITNCKYRDKNIIAMNEFKDYLKIYEKGIILDDLYEDCLNKGMDLVEVFNIINEIRKKKDISNKTKKLLEENNILINVKNINFICRGILNERVRLKYELLYFKEYYLLEYYYILLKDCPVNEIIEIIKKGYDEVKLRIKNYDEYRYEYKYLKLVLELYESGIDFVIEDRFIVEDYCFELDKENEKLTLIINKLNSDIDKYISAKLSIIGTRPMNGKMIYLSRMLSKLMRSNKNITLFGLDGPINFYLEYLLTEITGLDRKAIRQYLNPCSCYKGDILSIDEEKYINGIRYLLNHNVTINDYHNVKDCIIEGSNTMLDKLMYMINDSESAVIIIDRIESIEGDVGCIFKKLKEIAKIKNVTIVLFTNLKREYEVYYKKEISSFENSELIDEYIDYINILDGEELYLIKGI